MSNKKRWVPLFLGVVLIAFFGCNQPKHKKSDALTIEEVDSLLTKSIAQYELLLEDAQKANRIPRTLDDDGSLRWTNQGFDWTDGFFPGTLWFVYELTGEDKWRKAAAHFQKKFEKFKTHTGYHDLGFVFNSSYGNGYRLTEEEAYKAVLVGAANSLGERFNPTVGSILSWDADKGWQGERGWEFPVIIDNMLNLELLFKATELTGDEVHKNRAIAHANTTLENHFREDNSSYHVVDYNPETGAVRSKETAQGYEHESSWARGQAWGVYGFTMCYRFTGDEKYLDQAQKIADYILNYKDMPDDGVPYWDYHAPKIPDEPRDASAAAITASALFELNDYAPEKGYEEYAKKLLISLKSDRYSDEVEGKNHFILKHSVGSIPHDNEIDVPLNYADYYYIEALMRYKAKLNK